MKSNDEFDSPLDPSVHEDLRALARPIEPNRDLWPAIARQVRSSRPPGRGPWIARLAAGLFVAVGAVLLFRLLGPAAPAAMVETAYAETDRALVSIRDELRVVVERQAQDLSPETRQLVFDNLQTIEQAIAEIEAALAKEPTNPELGRTVIAYRQRQIDLLRQVNRAAARL